MWNLLNHLWLDEVGSSQSTEMALVSGVTIGALVMGMTSFGNAVNNRFAEVELEDDSMAQLEQSMKQERLLKELSEEERIKQFRERRRLQLERKKQRNEEFATVKSVNAQ